MLIGLKLRSINAIIPSTGQIHPSTNTVTFQPKDKARNGKILDTFNSTLPDFHNYIIENPVTNITEEFHSSSNDVEKRNSSKIEIINSNRSEFLPIHSPKTSKSVSISYSNEEYLTKYKTVLNSNHFLLTNRQKSWCHLTLLNFLVPSLIFCLCPSKLDKLPKNIAKNNWNVYTGKALVPIDSAAL